MLMMCTKPMMHKMLNENCKNKNKREIKLPKKMVNKNKQTENK